MVGWSAGIGGCNSSQRVLRGGEVFQEKLVPVSVQCRVLLLQESAHVGGCELHSGFFLCVGVALKDDTCDCAVRCSYSRNFCALFCKIGQTFQYYSDEVFFFWPSQHRACMLTVAQLCTTQLYRTSVTMIPVVLKREIIFQLKLDTVRRYALGSETVCNMIRTCKLRIQNMHLRCMNTRWD